MFASLDRDFGPDCRPRLADAQADGIDGALACLESFYYALNQRNLDVLAGTWADDALVQLNNPVGGILRGRDAVVSLYERIFAGELDVKVTFGDAVRYDVADMLVVAGRERGDYRGPDGTRVPLSIRTSRVLANVGSRWVQVHHHGSIDDAAALQAYKHAALGPSAD